MDTKFTFWKLIDKYKIEIPIIQRDYAQGRPTARKIAERFLNDLKKSIRDNSPLNLDFIYGKVESNGEIILVPLDGQQRLTTLFLLHWYLAWKENKLAEYETNLLKFTYETRPSSRDFCRKLVSKPIPYSPEKRTISEAVRDSNWFFLSWERDPTVVSMLNMLDLIHEKFGDFLWRESQGLFDADNAPITFLFLPLAEFKLSDELYIKINARGKPLTPFENFKAGFSRYLKNFADQKKLDNKWLDIFWRRAKEKDEVHPEIVDRDFFYFFTNIALNLYVAQNEIDALNEYDLFKTYTKVYEKDDNVDKVIQTLDALAEVEDSGQVFSNFLKPLSRITYGEQVRFHALMQFFYRVGKIAGNEVVYKRWMRVTKNLINNTLTQSVKEYMHAIRSIDKLSNHIWDIYSFVAESPTDIDYFLKRQREEESLKAGLILKDEAWEKRIEAVERHPYFDGQIRFILDYTKEQAGDYDLELFVDYSEKLELLFSDFNENYDFLFWRALLTKGDYLVQIGPNRTFCKFELGLRAKIDNWRKVFNDEQKTGFLKELLDDIDRDDVKGSLIAVVEENRVDDWWRNCLIENPQYISYCRERQIRFRDKSYGETKIFLLLKKQMNGRHAELHSYDLYKKKFNGKSFSPFAESYYRESSSWKDPAIMMEWKYHHNDFVIKIGYDNEFYIKFLDRDQENIPTEIRVELEEMGFVDDNSNDESGYKFDGIRLNEVILELERVCAVFARW